MKTKHLMGSLVAVCAVATMGSAVAAAGYEVPAAGFKSTMSRTDVQRELIDARGDGSAASRRIDGDENIGARGAAGSRYSTPTRDEVRRELWDQSQRRSLNSPNMPGSIYYGD